MVIKNLPVVIIVLLALSNDLWAGGTNPESRLACKSLTADFVDTLYSVKCEKETWDTEQMLPFIKSVGRKVKSSTGYEFLIVLHSDIHHSFEMFLKVSPRQWISSALSSESAFAPSEPLTLLYLVRFLESCSQGELEVCEKEKVLLLKIGFPRK